MRCMTTARLLSVRLDARLAEALERHCAQTGATRSDVVKQSVAQYIVEHAGPTLGGLAARRARSGSGTTCVRSVVVDSGFLIGLFDETDALHKRCREFLKDYRGRFLTTEAVLTEALALLSIAQQLRCLDWLADA